MTSPERQPEAAADNPATAAPRNRARKWTARIGFGVLFFMVLVFVGVQVGLWTGLPQSIVVGEVEKGFGLRMGVNSLSTGWLGHTSMSGVKIALPLSQQAFLEVPEMKVNHTGLIPLIFGADVAIKSVELHNPLLYVRQNVAGKWNLEEVIELLARAGGKKTGEQTAQTSAPSLPQITVTGMTIVVIDNQNRQARVEPINVNGAPDSPVAWKYDVEIPSQQQNVQPHLSLVGRVVPGTWQHEAAIQVHDIARWVEPWAQAFNMPVSFSGKWSGQPTTDGLTGFLQIKDLSVGDYHADGALSATQNGSVFSVSPDNLHLSQSDPTLPGSAPRVLNINIPRGTIDYDGKVARATQVQLALLGGPATFNGWFEPDINQGALEAYWQNLAIPNSGVTQSGKLNLTYTRPVAAPLRIELSANTSGIAQKSPLNAVLKLSVTGNTFSDLAWQLSTPELAYYHGPQPILLNGLNASGTYVNDAQEHVVKLARLSLPADNRLAGNASYDFVTKKGQAHVEGQDWPLHIVAGIKLAFAMDASVQTVPSTTDPKKSVPLVELTQFVLKSGDTSLSLEGTFDGRRPKPVQASVTFANSPAGTAQTGEPTLIQGYVMGTANLVGTLTPQNIAINGSLMGRNAQILGHPLGDLSTLLSGSIDDEKATIRADGIPFLGGIWNLGATYVTEREDEPIYATTIDLSVDGLPLINVSDFLSMPNVSGTFAGHWLINFPGLNPDPAKIDLSGSGKIQQFVASYLVADEVNFTTTLKDSIFKIDPVRLTRGHYGRIDAGAELSLDQWRQVNASLRFTAFPIDITPAALNLQLWGGSDAIRIDLPNAVAKDVDATRLQINTNVNLRTVVTINNQPEGEIRQASAMQGRIINVTQVEGDLLGGSLSGSATADLDHLFTRTKANFAWKELQAARLVRLYPALKGFGGNFSGTATLKPATISRPLEPLALDIETHPAKGHWRTVELGGVDLHAYLGQHRLIASDVQASTIRFGASDGSVDLWFASSDHIDTVPLPSGQEKPVGITVSNQLNLTLRAIALDPFVSALDPGHAPGFGRIGGKVFLLSAPKSRPLVVTPVVVTPAPTTSPATAPAATRPVSSRPAVAPPKDDALQYILRSTAMDGNLIIGDADLGDFGPIAFLYNLMHLGKNIRKPTGYGTITLHMEDGNLHISNLNYFNRGIEVTGVAAISQIWRLDRAPIEGSAVGSLRPFKDIKLPVFAEIDALLTEFQGQLTAVMFKGTLQNPDKTYLKQLNLSELGGELRGILLNEFGSSHQQQ